MRTSHRMLTGKTGRGCVCAGRVAALVLFTVGACAQSFAAGSGLGAGHRDDAMSPATTDEGQARSATDMDAEFLAAAVGFSRDQIAASRVIAHETGNSEIRAYAGRMSLEHEKLAEALHSLSMRHSIETPNAPPNQSNLNEMASKQLPAVDRHYLSVAGSAALRRIILVYEDEAKHGREADIRKFATSALTTLHRELSMAQALEKKVFPNQ
ncbi:hypothetical protein RO07_25110 [Pandoraea pulmonicola]|uniref:Predicted outer membrane protein n=2 Tax=Pandoraea pulmonicola TaxID=93221 RepID=A0AAJ5D0T4_PANPU|nr:hypothetical protein RO07_25110 [Pandoraea pulmonicola]SUA91043.1 Predicted outer membrane protein [Pandoraea pulmonicola]